MSKNSNLHNAKRAKQDEFYTQWVDIEKEMNAYLDYNPDVFRDKTILLPCDDPEWSNFTKYFALRFQDYGIKKLISTSYAPKSNMNGAFYIPRESLFFEDKFDKDKDFERGKIFVLDGQDVNQDGRVNIEDFTWEYLEGDGDFRSEEITALRDEADMVITNPPFSLFREFVAWLEEGEVEYSIIGSMNAITYKEIFPLIKDNKMWVGSGGIKSMKYEVPLIGEILKSQYEENGKRYQNMGNTCWFSNIQHGKRHQPIPLMSMEDNLRFNKRIMKNPNAYKKYDNYDAIEVPVTAGIPSDYEGIMGVPISFLDKYSPEQFEIVGIAKRGAGDPALKTKVYRKEEYANYSDLNAGPVIIKDGTPRNTYPRILIQHKLPNPKEK